ncbi:MAG: CPBP family intramembrane metalloprotease [Muribaculaceae bacterium]|nr:CPBP family intramembrane metalloprotease [Muribaculaceae bacterium]
MESISGKRTLAGGSLRNCIICIVLAFVLWTIMFWPFGGPPLNFWAMMTFSALTLTTLTTIFMPKWWHSVKFTPANIAFGLCIAIVLWCAFWIGDKVSQWMFDFSREQVNGIYGMKGSTPPWLLSILLLFIIGPAEEIFWRGYIQKSLSLRYSPNIGFIVTTAIYTLVHIGSLNFMLIMSALVCGIAWGGLYRLFPNRFAAIILSHAVWDAAVFVWFPI